MQAPHNTLRRLLEPRKSPDPSRWGPFTGRHRRYDPRVLSRRARGSAAAVLLLVIGAAPASVAERPDSPSSVAADPADMLAAREQAAEIPSRSMLRGTAPEPPERVTPVPRAAPPSARPAPEPPEPPAEEAAEEPATEPAPAAEEEQPAAAPAAAPGPPAPIGGLTTRQMEHATTIIRVGQELGLPEQAWLVALATVLQESYLRVLASPAYPESYQQAHDDVGFDHDSVGLFQQRPSMGWGTVAECMDPASSSRIFYQALQQVPGWQSLPITVAAQTVQVSAYPDHYAKHEPLARELVALLR